jgi:hypothetical protein
MEFGMATSMYQLFSADDAVKRIAESMEDLQAMRAAGDLFAVSGTDATGDVQFFPEFQFEEQADKEMLRFAISEFREAGLPTAFLWSVLRTGTKDLDGLDPIEILLGACTRDIAGATRGLRLQSFKDVIQEAVARIRW